MPVKLDFQVISCTGEDEKFRATELNYHGPTVRGWRSPAKGIFPQEIILQLKVLANLHQIQILSHQYLIAKKIELFISSENEKVTLCNNFEDFFEYLGFITFSDNKATGFHSRELKSIFIPFKKAKHVKLRIHNNHVNDKNVYNQVALIAINLIGDELQFKDQMNNDINLPCPIPHDVKLLENSNYTSPYDDLGFRMSVDEETARIIKLLESKMLQALHYDHLKYVNTLELTLENLRVGGEILGIYEQEKKRAINLEDFDRAKQKKMQIDHFRQKIYNTLRIEQLLESFESLGDYDLKDNTNDQSKYLYVNPSTNHQTSVQNLTEERTPTPDDYNLSSNCEKSSRFLCPPRRKSPPQIFHSKSQTFSDSSSFKTASFTTSLSNPHLHKATVFHPNLKLDTSLEQVGTPSSGMASLTEDESDSIKTSEKLKHVNNVSGNGSLIPRRELKKLIDSRAPSVNWCKRDHTSLSEHRIRSKTVTDNEAKNSFEAYEERILPALKTYHGNAIVRECQIALNQRQKSALNEREKKQAGLPISVFGMELIEKFYSKSFTDKEEGLKELQREFKNVVKTQKENLETKPPQYNKMARAVVFLLQRGIRDKVYSVYSLAAETIRIFFTDFVPQRVSPSEVARSIEKLLPELLNKSGDITPRIHNMAAHTLLSIAECEEVRQLNIIPTQLSRPLTSSVHPRLALSRLEMVEQLILNNGISKDKKSGLTCRTLAEFGSSGLHHPSEAVRKVSERILIHVYKINPRIVRKQLPPDDNVTRRNLLYRHLFQEFDALDVEKKLSEQIIDHSKALAPDNQIVSKSATLIKPATNHLEMKTKSIKLLPFTNNDKSLQKFPNKAPVPFETSPVSKKKEEDLLPMTEKKIIQKPTENNEVTLKFPTLTDSIKITKTRMEQKDSSNNKPNSFFLRKKENIVNSVTKTNFSSGIPLPTLKNCAIKLKPKEKAKNLEKILSRSRIPSKTTKPRPLDSGKEGPKMNDSLRRIMTFHLNEAKECNISENVKLSDSMQASIRENELSALYVENEIEERLKSCIFCLSSENWTSEDSLNKHYLKECLMLTTCEYCMEVTEILSITHHLLDDCKWKHIFQKCKTCHQAVLKDMSDKHECLGKAHISRCPFCHTDVGDGETSWRKHLMGTNMCLHHPRRK